MESPEHHVELKGDWRVKKPITGGVAQCTQLGCKLRRSYHTTPHASQRRRHAAARLSSFTMCRASLSGRSQVAVISLISLCTAPQSYPTHGVKLSPSWRLPGTLPDLVCFLFGRCAWDAMAGTDSRTLDFKNRDGHVLAQWGHPRNTPRRPL